MVELSKELQQALDSDPAVPRLVDPRNQRTYVLLPTEQYERIKSLIEQGDELSDTYAAQVESGMRAGWGDPIMDEYDAYDEHRR